MATTYLQRSTGTPTSQTKFTVSAWVKRSGLNPSGNNMDIFCIYSDSSNRMHLRFQEDDIDVINYGGSTQARLTTDRKFRDTNSWYHIVWRVDTTLATADDRVRLYINGVQETSFSVRTNPSQNFSFGTNWNITRIGLDNSSAYFDGIISHFHYSDGYSYAPTVFGSTDSTTGEWKINTSPTFTLGNNGFTVLKDGNTITDQSSNSNDFSAGGATLTKTEDCPSNVFNCFNPNIPLHSDLTLSNGNTTLSSTNGQWLGTLTTMPLFGGKWYYECKYNTGHGIKLSIQGYKADLRHWATANNSYGDYNDNGYGYQFNNSGNDYLGNNASAPNWGGGLSSNTGNKIYMVALNLENGNIWYGADGTWFDDASGNTGNPSTDAYPHQTISATHLAQTPLLVCGSVEGNGATMNWNFGNGYFGTTAVSSAGNNASGIGIFEYDVPTGFTAISTKGLNE